MPEQQRFIFTGQRVAMATLHGKVPLLAEALRPLGLTVVHAAGVDTNQFGTFDGRIARQGTPLQAARAKVAAAFSALPDLDFAVASEGSYGAASLWPGLTQGHELVLLMHRPSGTEWWVGVVDPSPMARSAQVSTLDELRQFAQTCGFASQGLLLDGSELPDDATLWGHRLDGVTAHLVQTDLRAHRNPRRRETILDTGRRLALRLETPCPHCALPGFGLSEQLPGLPCGACGEPTRMPLTELTRCQFCQHQVSRPLGAPDADPQWCDLCNP